MAAKTRVNEYDKIRDAYVLDNDVSDRVAAILTGAFIEDYLGRAIQARLPGLTDDLREKLFEKTALANAVDRIDMARAMNIVDAVLHKDLVLIARIRNRFAHRHQLNRFGDEPVHSLVRKLSTYQQPKLNAYLKERAKDEMFAYELRCSDGRLRFNENALRITMALHNLHIKDREARGRPSP